MMILVITMAAGVSATFQPIRVAEYVGAGSDWFNPQLSAGKSLRILNAAPGFANVTLLHDEDALVAQLKPGAFDVVFFPGGSGGGEKKSLGIKGAASVQAFVKAGGGYLGICAGAYLAEPLGLIKYKKMEPWDRGDGDVLVQWEQAGRDALQLGPEHDFPGWGLGDGPAHAGNLSASAFAPNTNMTLHYGQGPIFANEDSPAYTRLATYKTEIHKLHPKETTGEMVGTAAVITALYGKGRVLLSSPHPELTSQPGRKPIIERYARYAARRDFAPGAPALPSCASAAPADAPLRIMQWNGEGADERAPTWTDWQRAPGASVCGASTEADLVNYLKNDRFDVIYFPGGGGEGETKGAGPKGTAAIQAFVKAGGGYVGVCAGAYNGENMGLLAAGKKEPYNRGDGTAEVTFTDDGVAALKLANLGPSYAPGANLTLMYAQGPIFCHASPGAVCGKEGGGVDASGLPAFTTLATYRSEVNANPAVANLTKGQMLGAPAIVTAPYGKGRVLLSGPHPELSTVGECCKGPGPGDNPALLLRYVRYAAGQV